MPTSKDDAFGRPTVSTCFKPLSLHREKFSPSLEASLYFGRPVVPSEHFMALVDVKVGKVGPQMIEQMIGKIED